MGVIRDSIPAKTRASRVGHISNRQVEHGESVLRAAYQRFRGADGSEMAAALAYRLLVALFPFLILVTALAGAGLSVVGGDEPAQTAIRHLDAVLSDDVARLIEGHLAQVARAHSAGPAIGAFAAALWTGLIGGNSVVRHLNTIHAVEEDRRPLRLAGIALAVSFATSVAATCAMLVLVLGSVERSTLAGSLGLGTNFAFVVELVRWPIALVFLTAAAAISYLLAPARRPRLRPVVAGSLLFGAVWTMASGLLAVYLANVGTMVQTYGALTGLIALLLWMYVTGLAFVIGAVVSAEMEARRA